MKPPDRSWRQYLQDGIRRMEGTHPEPPWEGRKWYLQANWVFEDCIAQSEDVAVQIEASFRRAQCAHYQQDEQARLRWLDWGDQRLQNKALPAITKVHGLFRKSEILLEIEDRHAALAALSDAFAIAPEGEPRLLGEIAYRVGCLRTSPHAAASWFRQSVSSFSAVPDPDHATWCALAEASSRAGVSLQRAHGYRLPEARQHLRRAQRILATQVFDPHLRASHWFRRFRVAARYGRPQAIWFLLHAALAVLSRWWQRPRIA